MTRETVGKVSSDLIVKEPETRSPIEQMQENLTQYDNNIHMCVKDGKRIYPHDFYVVVLTKKERLMENVLRNYFLHRSTCPTPDYDQAVYKYTRTSDRIEFLWVIPAKDICELMRENITRVDKSEYDLLKFVIDFYEGSLLKKARMLNGEVAL